MNESPTEVDYVAVESALQKIKEGVQSLHSLLPDEIKCQVTLRSNEEVLNPHTLDCGKGDGVDSCRSWVEKILENGNFVAKTR